MNEGGGLTAYDSSGFGNHGTLTSGAVWNTGIRGTVLDFNGAGAVLTVAGLPVNPANYGFSIAFWAYPRAAGSQIVIGWSTVDDLIIYPNRTGTTGMRIFWRDVGGNQLDTGGGPRTNEWHHYAFVSYASNDHRCFIDGVELSTSTSTGTSGGFDTFMIGGWADGGASFDGQLQDVRLYGRGLRAAEINSLFWYPSLEFNSVRDQLARINTAAAAASVNSSGYYYHGV